MKANWPACTSWSPFRPPWWRWGRAEHLIAHGWRRNQKVDDEWVAAARAVRQGRAVRHPRSAAIRTAHLIWAKNDCKRWELEALLLAGEPLDVIADRVQVEAPVVEAYEKVFFAVLDALQATDWIHHQVIGYSVWTGFTKLLPAAAWLSAAYVGGIAFLDVMMAITGDRPLPPGLFTAKGGSRSVEEVCYRLRFRLWLLLASVQDDAAVARLVRLKRKLDTLSTGFRVDADPGLRIHEQFLLALPRIRRKAAAGARKERQGRKNKTRTEATKPNATAAAKTPDRPPLRENRPRIDDSKLASKHSPNPRRVAAGKANRAKRKGLTPEGRQRLRLTALEHQPWRHASGPTTITGKARSAANGKGRQKGQYSVRALRAEFAAITGVLRSLGAPRPQAQGG